MAPIYIWKPSKQDGISLQLRTWDDVDPLPDGWKGVPPEFKNHFPLYLGDDDKPTRVKPKELADKEKAHKRDAEKIKKKIRKLAIDQLKAEGELSPNFEDDETMDY